MPDKVEEYLNSLTKYEMKENHSSIDKIKKRIREIEYAILHTRKTSRIRQNEKNLQRANQKLQMAIYQHNKFDIFNKINEAMEFILPIRLDEQMNSFAEVSSIKLGDDIGIITSPMQIESSKITHYDEHPKRTYYGFNNQSQELFNKEND